MLLTGRGFGKTRAGAETVIQWAQEGHTPIGLVGQTKSDVRDTMIELGDSAIMRHSPPWFKPSYEPSKRRLTWPNGAVAIAYSGDEPDQLRGPQHARAWVDELAKFKYPQESWDNLEFGMRGGEDARVVITTTPRPIPVIRKLMADPGVIVVRGSLYENRENLPEVYVKRIIDRYGGTRLGRQEIEGEVVGDVEGALWTRQMIEECRVRAMPALRVAALAIDPAVTAKEGSAETGMILGGIGEDGHGYVTDDLSGIYTPDGWARRAVNAYYTSELNEIVAEVNNGGDLVKNTIRHMRGEKDEPLGQSVRVLEVRATRGKFTRAEPVAALYEQHRIHHVGAFPQLEDQLCTWVPGEKSPDRLDSLVWLFTHLLVEAGGPLVLFEA